MATIVGVQEDESCPPANASYLQTVSVPRRSPPFSLAKRGVAEAIGTAMLLATVVGSGIMGDRLAGGNVAIALLADSIATGAVLVALILTFGPISGSHLNPAVTIADAAVGGLAWADVPVYAAAQCIGAVAGVVLAHLMFGLPAISTSTHARSGAAQFLSEVIASFGLLAVIAGCSRTRISSVPYAVGLYIAAAYWFTASTSFANPAVTIARSLTNTFSGIRLADVPAFIAAQFLGTLAAVGLFAWFYPHGHNRS